MGMTMLPLIYGSRGRHGCATICDRCRNCRNRLMRHTVPANCGTGSAGTSEQVGRFQPKGRPSMRVSTAYFAGAGTVVAAIVGGVGGGLLIADMISPKLPKGTETTRLERRMSPEPIRASEPAAAEQSTSPSS